jgi:hypothetical protein
VEDAEEDAEETAEEDEEVESEEDEPSEEEVDARAGLSYPHREQITWEEARNAFNDFDEDIPVNERDPDSRKNAKNMFLLFNYFNGPPADRGSMATRREGLAEPEPAEPEPEEDTAQEEPRFHVLCHFLGQVKTIYIKPTSTVTFLKKLVLAFTNGASSGSGSRTGAVEVILRFGEDILSNNRRQLKTEGIVSGSTLYASFRGRGGAAKDREVIKSGIKTTQKIRKQETELRDRFLLLEDIGKQLDTSPVSVLEPVKMMTKKIRKFLELVKEKGGEAAMTIQIGTCSIESIDYIINYMRTTGSNTPSQKLDHVAIYLFEALFLRDLETGIDNMMSAVKVALAAGFADAVLRSTLEKGTSTFNLNEFVTICRCRSFASSSSSSVPAIIVENEADNIMANQMDGLALEM